MSLEYVISEQSGKKCVKWRSYKINSVLEATHTDCDQINNRSILRHAKLNQQFLSFCLHTYHDQAYELIRTYEQNRQYS